MSAPVPSSVQPPKLSDVRAERVNRDDYIGSISTETVADMFAWKEDITSGNADVLAFNDGNGDLAGGPAYLCVIGTVLADRPYLLPHGNYQPQYGHSFSDAKLQFTVGSAGMADRGLGDDFDRGIRIVEALQIQGAVTPSHNHLIRSYRNRKGLRMSFPLFSPRNGPSAENDGTLAHPVAPDYISALQGAATTHSLNAIPFFDHRNIRLSPAFLEQQMVGSVVEVWFTLHHYAVTPKGAKSVTSDTFQARAVQVRVLRKFVPSATASPFTSTALSTPWIPPAQSWRAARARAGAEMPSTPPTFNVTLTTPPHTPPQVQPQRSSTLPVPGPSTPPGGGSFPAVPTMAPITASTSVGVGVSPEQGYSATALSLVLPDQNSHAPVHPVAPSIVSPAVPVVLSNPAAVQQAAIEAQDNVAPVDAIQSTTGTTIPSIAVPAENTNVALVVTTPSSPLSLIPPSELTTQGGSSGAFTVEGRQDASQLAEAPGYRDDFNAGRVTRNAGIADEGSKAAGKRKAVVEVDGVAKRTRR